MDNPHNFPAFPLLLFKAYFSIPGIPTLSPPFWGLWGNETFI